MSMIINPFRFVSAVGPAIPIASLWAYFEADSYSAQADGSPIATNWTDKSGNSNHAVHTGSLGATYETNEINGQPVVRLGAVSDDSYFTLPAMNVVMSGGGTEISVLKVNTLTTSGGDRFGSAAVAASHYPFSGAGIYDSFGSTTRINNSAPITPLNAFHVRRIYSMPNDRGMYLNEAVQFTSASNTVSFHTSPRFGNNGSQYMRADIAAKYYFIGKLAGADLSFMKSYINTKFGFSLV